MRTPLLLILLVVVPGCGRGELATSPLSPEAETGPTASTSRVRLESNFARSDGFRFSDRALLTRRTVNTGRCAVYETQTSDGAVVEGEAARTDLQTDTGRIFALYAPEGAGCVTRGLVSSVAEVDASACTDWTPTTLLQLSLQGEPDFVGTGIVVRTARGQGYRVRIVQSGFDAVGGVDFVTFDFEAIPLTCATDGAACVVRDDCCNSRHSCIAGTCQY